MSAPLPAAVSSALGRVMPAGPPEHAAMTAGPPGNGAGGLLDAASVPSPHGAVPAASRPATLTASAPVALSIVGGKVPLNLVPSASPQPRVVSTPVGTLVSKAAPVAPVQQLPRPSSGGVRLAAPHPVASKAPQTTTLQLPANFQIPQGTVLVRSNTGQLMLVSQQALVQAQSQTQKNTSVRQSVPTNASTFKIRPVQNSGTQMLKVLTAPVKAVSWTPHSVPSTIKKPAVIQTASTNSIATVTTVKPLSTGLSAKPPPPPPLPAFDSPALSLAPNSVDKEGTTAAQASTTEMLENVKKCKNFLATLIKLASSGPQTPEMGQNVKNLVQSLLEAKIEPEEFTKKLYIELKSSPQPYLVPFLKKSMLAIRQLMPNTQNFMQQCFQQSVAQASALPCTTALTAASVVATSAPTTTAPLPSARADPRTPLGIPPSQVPCSIPCTSLVTRGSGSLHFVQPAHGLSVGAHTIQSANPSSQLTTGVSAVNAVHLTSSTAMVTTGTTSLQVAKPVLAPTVSSVLTPLSSVKCVSSTVATTPSLKPVLITAATTPTTGVTTSLQSTRPVPGAPITIRVAHPNSILSQSVRTSQGVKVKQLIVQQPSGGMLKKVTTLQPTSAVPFVNKFGEKMPLNALIQASQLPTGSIVKQITLPGNKILSLQASPVHRNKIRENGTTSFRDEDDINDVTSMAGVNLNEESACILAANAEAVGTLIQSCSEELLLFSDALEKKILEIGKRHDITEVNSDVLNLISHATQERLRGLLDKLTLIAQHRIVTYKDSNKYIMSNDTRAQLKFLEKLDQMEKQRRDEEERERLFRAAKSRSNKEDPEQLRLKQKAKEIQQLELAQMQQREANRAALAAIGPRKKRPLDSLGLEDLNRSPSLARSYIRPRITRICLRDLIFCMEQERSMKCSLALYQALLK